MIVTDWEGPWVANDFAYEIISNIFSPELFKKLSAYDDYLAYEVKRPNYSAGWTLKLIAPFIVAKGITSKDFEELSSPKYIPNAFDASKILKFISDIYVVSTAYIQFLKVSCKKIGFNNFYGTEFYPDKYTIPENEKELLLKVSKEIINEDFSWLDEFFWKKMKSLRCWKIFEDVKVIGSVEKREIAKKLNAKVAIGDSISDYLMLEYVKSKKGLAISFNGNEYAIKHSNLAVISETSLSISIPVLIYHLRGIEGVKEICESSSKVFEILESEKTKIKNLLKILDYFSKKIEKTKFFFIPNLDTSEIEEVIKLSKKMRVKMRGGAGELG